MTLLGFVFVFLSLAEAFGYLQEAIFFSLDWKGYSLLASVPLLVGLSFTVSSFSEDERFFHGKMWYLYGLVILFGMILYAAGLLAFYSLFDNTSQTAMGADYSILLIISILPAALGTFLIITSPRETKDKFWKFRIIWLLFALVGLLLAVLGVAVYFIYPGNADAILPGMNWYDYLIFALVPLIIGTGLFLGSLSEGAKEFLWKFKYLGLLAFLIGLLSLVYALASFFIGTDNLMDPILQMPWYDLNTVYLLPLGLGLALLAAGASEDGLEFFSKLKFIFFIILIGGFFSYLAGIAAKFLYPDTQALASLQWDHWLAFGFLFAISGVVLLYSLINSEDYSPPAFSKSAFSQELKSGGDASADAVVLGKIKLDQTDQLGYFNVAKRIAKYSKDQYKEAKKDSKLSDKAYRVLSSKMDAAIKQYNKKIAEIEKQTEVKDRKRLFEQELGIPTAKKAAPPVKKAVSSPPPLKKPKVAASKPKPASPPPVIKPKIVETKPSPPSPLPPPVASPKPTPPAPSPAKSGESMDVVGTARSTSIAELRGEMLKELSRLRDIFKDEEE